MDEELGKKETKDESSGVKEIQEETTNDSLVKSIAGIEHWPDLAANTIRPSLPRRSKTMHKIVKNMQGGMLEKVGKGSNKNLSQ